MYLSFTLKKRGQINIPFNHITQVYLIRNLRCYSLVGYSFGCLIVCNIRNLHDFLFSVFWEVIAFLVHHFLPSKCANIRMPLSAEIHWRVCCEYSVDSDCNNGNPSYIFGGVHWLVWLILGGVFGLNQSCQSPKNVKGCCAVARWIGFLATSVAIFVNVVIGYH